MLIKKKKHTHTFNKHEIRHIADTKDSKPQKAVFHTAKYWDSQQLANNIGAFKSETTLTSTCISMEMNNIIKNKINTDYIKYLEVID